MFYCRVLYHGTDKKSAKSIIAENFKPSEGDNHWLGDGVYFYEEKFHAFKWVWHLKNKKGRKQKIYIDDKDTLKHYSVIKVEVNIDESRVFDLTKIEHKLEFEWIYKWIYKKIRLSDKFKERLKRDGACAEGVIFNFMFEQMEDFELGYSKDYDMVRALFPKPHWKYNTILEEEIKSCLELIIYEKNRERRGRNKPPLNLNEMNHDELISLIAKSLNEKYDHRKYRITFMPEIQICVKNPYMLKKIIEHDCENHLDELLIYVKWYGDKLEEG